MMGELGFDRQPRVLWRIGAEATLNATNSINANDDIYNTALAA
jgi:hypothetical protein